MECGETWNLMVLRVEFKCKSCNLSTKIDYSADSKTKQISQIALFRNLRHLYTILFFFIEFRNRVSNDIRSLK